MKNKLVLRKTIIKQVSDSLSSGELINTPNTTLLSVVLGEYNKNHDRLGRFSASKSSGGVAIAGGKTKKKLAVKKYTKVKKGFLDAKTRAQYLKDVTAYMKDNGGITVALDSAKNMPDKGLSYSPYPDAETIIPKNKLTEAKVLEFVKKNRKKLATSNAYIGGWYNSEDGNFYLDVAKVGGYSADTIAKAQKAKQLAVFDLKTFNEITIGTRTEKGYIKNDKATSIYEQAFGNGNGRTVGETLDDSVRGFYAGTGRDGSQSRRLVDQVIAEIRKDRKYSRDSKGRFATVNTLGARVQKSLTKKNKGADHIKDIDKYKNDPKAPSKVAKELDLIKPVSKERAEEIIKNSMSPESYAQYKKDLKTVNDKIKAHQTTEEVFGVKFDKEGRATEYTLERQKLHNEIMYEYQMRIVKDIHSSKPPKMLVIMGRPGSGKSSFEYKEVASTDWAKWKKDEYLAIDPDEIKGMLGAKNFEVGLYHEESSYLSKRVLQMAVDLKSNIAYDQTLASDKSAKILGYKNQGYSISAVGVSTSVEVSLANAAKRYANRGANDGRLVTPEVSTSNITNESNFEKVIPLTNGDWSYYVGQVKTTDGFGFTEVASGQ